MGSASYVGATCSPVGPVTAWPVVELSGVRWHVAPVYLAPVARRDVWAACDAWECELPTRELVDAIWKAGTIRLEPSGLFRHPNDLANGASMLAYLDQRNRIDRALADAGFGPDDLVVGTHKDFAVVDGSRIDLYGWHTLAGKPIEPGRTSHNDAHVDYSQGLRLVRRVGAPTLRPETWTPRALEVPS